MIKYWLAMFGAVALSAASQMLLKKAAILLQEVFDGDDIYRAGGDEFTIILGGCEEADFNSKVAHLKEISQDPDNVCFAVGSCFVASGCDIRDALRLADEAMYGDKMAYYETYPERKHR